MKIKIAKILLVAVWAKMPWLDPVGAILLSLYIIYEWVTVLLGKLKIWYDFDNV